MRGVGARHVAAALMLLAVLSLLGRSALAGQPSVLIGNLANDVIEFVAAEPGGVACTQLEPMFSVGF